jgi:ABC-2 type transport system permease protein
MIRIYLLEARSEFLKFARLKTYAMSVILFPLMFYCFFGLMMPGSVHSSTPMARYLIASYGAFAVMGSSLYAFGVGVAVERGLGWLEVKRASPMPIGAWFFAKAAVSVAFGAVVVLLLFALGAGFGGVRMTSSQWLLTFLCLVAGAAPFCALGLTIGNVAGANSAPGTVNMIYMPMAFCGGLWIPYEFLPRGIQQVAQFLPSYHLGQIALAIQRAPGASSIANHVEALAAFWLVFLGTAWLAHSRAQDRAAE